MSDDWSMIVPNQTESVPLPALNDGLLKHKSRLLMGYVIIFSIIEPRPNAFRRFWYWALLGLTWESLE